MTTPRIALSFEAGGDPAICGQMLDVLGRANAPATIFLAGMWSDQYPELVRRMAGEGHEFANHSYSHPDLTLCDDAQVRDELRRTDETIRRLTGQRAFPWFRPPYDAVDARVLRIAREEGYRLVQRTALDGGHWPGETTRERILSRSLENACDGAVLTYHLDSRNTLTVLPKIIERLRRDNFTLVSLSELLSVSERPERHPDFTDLVIDPGYLQVLQRGAPAWSMNVVEFGARANIPSAVIPLVAAGGRVVSLLVSDALEGWQAATPSDRYLLILAGEVECNFRARDDSAVRLRVVGRPGDLALWPAGYEIATGIPRQRWMMLIFA